MRTQTDRAINAGIKEGVADMKMAFGFREAFKMVVERVISELGGTNMLILLIPLAPRLSKAGENKSGWRTGLCDYRAIRSQR